MSESKRDLSGLLWGDLANDEERLEFLRLGMAVRTGIIAPAIVDQVYQAFHFLYTNQQYRELHKQQEGSEG